jgi:hypothetical protein
MGISVKLEVGVFGLTISVVPSRGMWVLLAHCPYKVRVLIVYI